MARYRLGASMVGQPDNAPYQKLAGGRTVADSVGNAVGSDVVWSSLCASPNPTMVPIDASAAAIMLAKFGASNPNICVTVGGASPAVSGSDSVA